MISPSLGEKAAPAITKGFEKLPPAGICAILTFPEFPSHHETHTLSLSSIAIDGAAFRLPSLTTAIGLLQVLPESDEAVNMIAETVALTPVVFCVSYAIAT